MKIEKNMCHYCWINGISTQIYNMIKSEFKDPATMLTKSAQIRHNELFESFKVYGINIDGTFYCRKHLIEAFDSRIEKGLIHENSKMQDSISD